MKYIVTTGKTIEQATKLLGEAVARNGFGVLHVHDLKATMNKKGVDFSDECRVFEVCNPHKANAVLSEDMSLNMVLPCRISIWEEDGQVKIGTLKPTALVSVLNDTAGLKQIAQEVEETLIAIIDETR